MKTKLTVMLATLVAISSLGLRAQELTDIQKNAILQEAVEAEKAQLQAAIESAILEELMTPEQKIARLEQLESFEKNKPPMPPSPKAAVDRMLQKKPATSLKIINSETQTSMVSEGGGIIFQSLNVDPKSSFGIKRLNQWSDTSGQWYSVATTYYPSNGSAMKAALNSMPVGTGCTLSTAITNNYNIYGEPRFNVFEFTYKTGIFSPGSNDRFYFSVGGLGNDYTSIWATNLPASSTFRTVVKIIPSFVVSSIQAYLVLVRNGTITPDVTVENNIKYYPYVPEWEGIRYSHNSTNKTTTISWDYLHQPTNHFNLYFAGNINGPWASNTTPVSVNGTIFSVTFGETNLSRFYRLQHF